MNIAEIKEILKEFPHPLIIEEVRNNHHAWHFIPCDEGDSPYVIIPAPYCLSDAYHEKQILTTNRNKYGIEPDSALLLLNTLVWDGKGFGVWVPGTRKNTRFGNQIFMWINLNFNSEGALKLTDLAEANECDVDLELYKDQLKTFKTHLVLMGFDITPVAERI